MYEPIVLFGLKKVIFINQQFQKAAAHTEQNNRNFNIAFGKFVQTDLKYHTPQEKLMDLRC